MTLLNALKSVKSYLFYPWYSPISDLKSQIYFWDPTTFFIILGETFLIAVTWGSNLIPCFRVSFSCTDQILSESSLNLRLVLKITFKKQFSVQNMLNKLFLTYFLRNWNLQKWNIKCCHLWRGFSHFILGSDLIGIFGNWKVDLLKYLTERGMW